MTDLQMHLYRLSDDILEEEAMIFVLYQDTSHPDNDNYTSVFEKVAAISFGSLTDTSLQWFKVDTLLYPELEDHRLPRAIFNA